MNVFRVLGKLLEYGRPHRPLLWAAFFFMVVLGVSTGLLAFLVGPAFKLLMTGGTQGADSLGIEVPLGHSTTLLEALPWLVAAVGLLKGLSYLGQFYFMGLYGQRITFRLRADLYEHMTKQSATEKNRQQAGNVLALFTSDVTAFEWAANYAVGSYVRDSLQVLVLLCVALFMDWRLALLSFVLVPIILIPASRLSRSVFGHAKEGQHRMGALAALVHEGMSAMSTIQAFNAQSAELRRFDVQAGGVERAAIKAAWARGAVPALMEILAAGSMGLVLVFAAQFLAVAPERLVSFVAAIGLVYQPAKELGRVTQLMVQASAAAERLWGFLSLPHVDERPQAQPLPRLMREIEFNDVHFSFVTQPVLQGVSLKIPKGQRIALVGPSGSGKSTLTSLLLGFQKPSAGVVSIDGKDASQFALASQRRQFALVTQEPLLFAASVIENIRFSRPAASDEEVFQAARVALADAFIRGLPDGYQTVLGERGQTLSGGQRQRLALARAVLSDAPVLLLDEATSQLDSESEREVLESIRRVSEGRTVLMVAHRLHTVSDVDCIYFLVSGRVVESGTHAQLLLKNGYYARMWATQQGNASP